MNTVSTRIFLGCVAGALAMLMFHQTLLQVFYWFGLTGHPAFRIANVPPFDVPMVVSVTFWGAVYGGIAGSVCPFLPRSIFLRGIMSGLFAMAMAWFVVRPVAGHPMAFGWQGHAMAVSAGANLAWGMGFAMIAPVLNPRCLVARSRLWAQRHLAA